MWLKGRQFQKLTQKASLLLVHHIQVDKSSDCSPPQSRDQHDMNEDNGLQSQHRLAQKVLGVGKYGILHKNNGAEIVIYAKMQTRRQAC